MTTGQRGGTLGALVEVLRTIQVAQGRHPWLLLELRVSQVKALILLAQLTRLRSRELADRLGIAPSATTPLVDRLVDQKLARRRPDPDDRRIVWIEPTAKGRGLNTKLMEMRASVSSRVMDAIPASKRPQVIRSLSLLLSAARQVLEGELDAQGQTPALSTRSARRHRGTARRSRRSTR